MRRHVAAALCCLALLAGCSRSKGGHYLYASNCGICHHGGQGMAGSVPPLVGRIDKIAATPQGRAYLAAVLINGVSGSIRANGQSYRAEMPPFRYLTDTQIATILSWLSEQGGSGPAPAISTAEIATARAHRIGAGDVAAMRAKLDQTNPLP
ncbi:cytochrome c [Acetobacter sacchari]|uniref:Cytochrome c n=1 Tax=Acetobacter sacchari TaxID=2661687 RepID=A0ABS3LUB9_9PROT|nr:cytochrome c [Acetobacter sacchari]MBO1359494.1 cytochrome c [Acetobacter sacchari]